MGNSATVPIEHDFDDGHHHKKSFRGKSLTAHGDQQKKKKTCKKSVIMQTVFLPIMLYGEPAWSTVSATRLKSFTSLAKKTRKNMLNAPRYVRTKEIRNDLNLDSVQRIIQYHFAALLEEHESPHITHMLDYDLTAPEYLRSGLSSMDPYMIPEPDYSDTEDPENRRKLRPGISNGVQFSQDGLVVPKKPPNPCLESSERQNLHRELLFNQKIGKSVIGQKTELQKAMEKFRDEQKKKELEEQKVNQKTAFEKKLEEQANKLKQQEELEAKKVESPDQPEFLRVHARVCAQTVDSTS